MLSFTATVKVMSSGGMHVYVTTVVFAEDFYKALTLLEAQYGQGNVVSLPYHS